MSYPPTNPAGAPERVLITGGAAGIGAAIAERCRAEGYLPVVIDRVVDAVHGGIRADLSDAADTARALQEALAGGPITRLVNNVGVVVPADAEHQTLAEFDLAVSLNLRCAFQCMQALLPGMKAAGFGRIVNMSSRAALGKELRTAYAATKAGLIGMTRVWALELGRTASRPTPSGPAPSALRCSTVPTRPTPRAPAPSSRPCPSGASARPTTWPMPPAICWTHAAASSRGRFCMSAAA